MALGRFKRTIKRSLSIVMAAALIATSIPQLSASATAQELGNANPEFEEQVLENSEGETDSEKSEPEESEQESDKETNSEQPTEETSKEKESDESTTTAKEETSKERESEECTTTKDSTKEENKSDKETESESDTVKETSEENRENEETKEDTTKTVESDEDTTDVDEYEKDKKGDKVTDNKEENKERIEENKGGKALRFQMKEVKEVSKWEDMIQEDINAPENLTFSENLKSDYQVSFDLYLPKEASFSGNYYVKAVTKLGDSWKWIDGAGESFTRDNFESCDENDKLVRYTFKGAIGEGAVEYDILKAIVVSVGSSDCTYNGVMFVDNVKLLDENDAILMLEDFSNYEGAVDLGSMEGISEGGDQEESDGIVIYKEDFNSWTSLEKMEVPGSNEVEPSLETIAEGNQAIAYSIDLSTSSKWADIFKASLKLPESYDKEVTDKLNMTFDVYIPTDSIQSDFGTMQAQAALKVGNNWTWITQKSWPTLQADDLIEDEKVSGYKKYTFSIDMNDFETWDNETQGKIPWDFANITPIQTVIPCLGGENFKYTGNIYLDNVCVTAYNKTEDVPIAKDDVVLDLDTSAWEVIEGYQYSGNSTIENQTIDNKKMLTAAVDYSANTTYDWSEAKFKYTHPETVTFEGSYNAFTADIYYKPANKKQGNLAVKISSGCLQNEKGIDAELPKGEAVTGIPELEGYYKSQLELVIETKKSASFSGLELGMVGKNTDFQGDIYFDNMKFTNIEVEDIYVDATVEAKKGDGVTVSADGKSITTASGQSVSIASEVSLVDPNANEATKNLYAYLKAIGESDSVIFGHQNDTHHKAGSNADGFSNSDTKDVTGSIAGVIGIDVLSLTGDEASEWNTPEADRIQKVAEITKEAAAEGALITLSAHMPNFDVIDQRVKAFEKNGKTGNKSDTLGYWEVDGKKQYNFSGYTPGTLSGNVVARIMPGQDLNYLFTDYLDLIVDYAKAVEGDGITILFRPFHENTGGWFWWGAASCDQEAYINLFRYTVDYIKEKDVHNILYVYGPGSEANNAAEYAQRYPGDAYVDMIGYDLYHSSPTKDNEAKYLADISRQNSILKEFATKHQKLYAITETGVANGKTALFPSGNEVKDWYMQLLNQISEEGVCYFLTWANFSDTTFYLPFVTKKNADGTLHGHETLDDFITFYNDNRSIFATDMNGGHKQIKGVTNTNKGDSISGYFTTPLSGDRILKKEQGTGTKIAVKLTGVKNDASNVKFVFSSDFGKETITASYVEKTALWEATLEDSVLEKLGESIGKITLVVGESEIAAITAIFNLAEAEQDDMTPDDFESYGGSKELLNRAWATNKDTGSEIAFLLTKDKDKVFGGNYALQIDVTLQNGNAWAGATKKFAADWSNGNALEFYTIPEKYGQKVVVQVTSDGVTYEAYLQEFEAYTNYAETDTPVKVSIPFSCFKDRDNKGVAFNPKKIESIGLWCNAIAKDGVTFPLETTLYYDEFKVVKTDKTEVLIEEAVIPDNPDNPDNPDDPDNPDNPDTPSVSAGMIYSNNFDKETDINNVLDGAEKSGATLAELAPNNKAILYKVDLTGTTEWTNIFQAQFNLKEPYTQEITDKAVMSFDVYFPADSINETFATLKAQAVFKTGAWNWTAQQSWPAYTAEQLEDDADVSGFKKLHIEIDMNNFKISGEDGEIAATIADITPIMAVVPCLAGDTSGYKGDIYLDNVKVEAFNRSGDAPELPPINENGMFLSTEAATWSVTDGWDYSGESKVGNITIQEEKLLVTTVDYSKDADKGWSEAKFNYTHPKAISPVSGYNAFQADVYYKPVDMTQGGFGIKIFCESLGIDKDAALPEGTAVENIAGLEGYYKSTFTLDFDTVNDASFSGLTLGLVGKNTNFKGDIYFGNMRFTKGETVDIYKETTQKIQKGAGITVAEDGRTITTASGKTVSVASEIALVDANANEATQKLYAYLKAIGESDSVIFGHQNDTHHKAGSTGEGFTNSDTKDITGSIAGVVGIDTLSLTGNEASTWDTPEAQRIQFVADLTRSAAAEGAVITLSAHMPNFDLIDQKVKAFEASNKTGNTSDTLGYWEVNGEKQYNFSGYTPGTLTGNVVARIMPEQDLNYLFTDYLDLIADYAKAVEKDGITILFRPFHENTGSWFWWGAALCDKEAYINLYRYTVDYLKEQGVHNLLYVYGPGSEAANAVEYAHRYPGDAYVDMIGYDLYHSYPTKENQAGYLENIHKQNMILQEFAQKHNKLYAITETGVANGSNALLTSENEVLDWYMQLLNEISDDGVCYFLTWANFNDTTSFYTPFVKEKRENGVLYGHEMLDEFIRFYNDEKSVFATDMHNGFAQLNGITNTTKENAVAGYIVSPISGDKLLPSQTEEGTRIVAKVTGIDKSGSVRFVLTSDFDQEICKASYNEESKMWEAILPDYALINLGEGLGTIVLIVNEQEIASISVGFNMTEAEQNDLNPEDFESYGGSDELLNSVWATNKATGSEIAFRLTQESEKVFGGNYGLEMEATLASSDAWVGAEKNFTADWSSGNALEFYTIPEKHGQKVVVQVKSNGEEFEIYLQDYPAYTNNAKSGIPVKVTIPFAAFVGRDHKEAVFNPAKIEKLGLWCNAIAQENVIFPLKTTLYYDELKIVKLANPEQKDVIIESIAKEGVWIREIAPQEYTGKAVKPEVAVYDGAKLLTLKKDYTVSYKNNKNAGNQAKVIIKGKGNYSETIEQTFEIAPKEMGRLTITYPEYLAYNGKEQAVAVTVKDGKKKLSSKKDYSVKIFYMGKDDSLTSVAKAKDEGKYQINITGKGNYSGEAVAICEVVDGKGLLSKASIKLPSSSLNYETGKAAVFEESAIVVKVGGKVVPQKEANDIVNYTVSYVNNTAPGTATVIITAGKDSAYVGSCRKDFAVKGAAFSSKTIGFTEFQTKLPYTGKPVFQNPVLTDKATGTELKKGVDYRVTYKNHVNAGKASMQFTGIGRYSGTFTKTYTITKAALTEDMLTSGKKIEVLQNRAGVQPDVVLLYQGKTLVNGQDYTLIYSNNKNITTESKKAHITIKGKGSFSGTLRNAVEMVILPKSLNSDDITIEVPDMQYSNKKAQYNPNPIVYDNGKKLVKNKDYTVSYEGNTKQDIGEIKETGHTAKVIITAKSADYLVAEEAAADGTENPQNHNTRIVEFRIIGKLIKDAKVTVKNSQYFSQQGTTPRKEDIEITYKGTKVENTEYEIISYSQNTKKGNAIMVLQGVGTYGGTKTVKFKINARGMHQNWADEMAEMLSSLFEVFS